MSRTILFILSLSFTWKAFAQKHTTELGFRLVNASNFIEQNGRGDSYFRTSIKSSLIYQQEVSSGMYFDFYKIKEIKTKGVYLPGIFLRQRIFKNIWIRALAEIYSIRSISESPFDIQMGTSSTSYSRYDVTKKGINIDYAIQYQWMNKKKLLLATGLESQFSWHRRIDKSVGYTCGCFNSSTLEPQSKTLLQFFSFPFITNSVSYKVNKNFFVSYEIATTIVNPFLSHRLSICKRL